MSVTELLVKGGPAMLALLGISVLGLALVMWKLLHVWQLQRASRQLPSDIRTELSTYGSSETLAKIEAAPSSALQQVILTAITMASTFGAGSEVTKQEMSRIASAQLQKLERGLRLIAQLGHMSPLVGLLGTVTGMIVAFAALEQSNMQADPSVLAGGIWEALLTTAAGLTIALPLLLAHFLLEEYFENIRLKMLDVSQQVTAHFLTAEVAQHEAAAETRDEKIRLAR